MHEMVWYNHNTYPPVVNGVVETIPDSQGVGKSYKDAVKVVEHGNFEALCRVVEENKGNVAALPLLFCRHQANIIPENLSKQIRLIAHGQVLDGQIVHTGHQQL